MNDLRHDPDTHAADPRVMAADALRTVPMPDPRTSQARELDAETRDLPHYDTRTEDERLLAELVRLVDCIQGLTLRIELVEGVIWQLARAMGIPEATE